MNKIIDKHSMALAAELKKAKKEKKWRGDGHGNLIENRAVNECIQIYGFIHTKEIQSELGLSVYNKCDIPLIDKAWKEIKAKAMSMAKAQLWTA